jgi:hypothetical protein
MRPSRPFLWIVILTCICAAIYWTQIAGESFIKRIKLSFGFSLRSAFDLKYGKENTATPFYKVLAYFQWMTTAVLVTLFGLALSNMVPVLHELVQRFLPH